MHGFGLHFGWIFWAIVLIGILYGVYYITQKRARDDSDAMEILRRRFAAGEISKAEFEERRDLLAKNSYNEEKP